MTIEVTTKLNGTKPYKLRYENVIEYSVFRKEVIKDEIDETSYNEMTDYVFRMYFEDGETSTWDCSPDFKHKVISYN